MATTLAYLLIRLGVDAKEFGAKMKAAEKTMEGVATGMKKAGNVLSIGVTAPMLAVAGASLKMAMDAQTSENLFSVSMGGMAAAARKWSEETSKALGLNAYSVRENVALFQRMFKAMGTSEESAYGMSKGLTELAYDFASLRGLKPEEAFDKLRAGIMGGSGALKDLGIVVDEATIKQVAWKAGLVDTTGELTDIQKVQARYLAIMQQTADVHGNLARTIDEPANQLRRMKAEAEATAIEFGNALIPLLKEATPILSDLASYVRAAAEALNRMDPETRRVAFGILAMVAAAGPVTRAFGLIMSVGGGVAGAFRTAAAEAGKLTAAKKRSTSAAIELSSAHKKTGDQLRNTEKQALALKISLAALAFEMGYSVGTLIRPWVQEFFNLDEVFGLVAEKNQDLLDALVADEEAFQDQLYAYDAARKSLGLLGEEWEVSAEHTKANAGQLAHLVGELEKIRQAHLAEAFAVRQATQARGDAHAQVARHMEQIKKEEAALRGVTDDLEEMYGILSREDVIDSMDRLVADFTLLARDGASGTQLMQAFAPKVAELADAAKSYTGLNLPDDFQQLQWVLEKGLVGWVEDLGGRLGRDIPDAAGLAETALTSSIGNAMLEAKGTVSKETEAIKHILLAMASEEYRLKLKVDLDTQAFDRWLKEHGLEPDTTGSAP